MGRKTRYALYGVHDLSDTRFIITPSLDKKLTLRSQPFFPFFQIRFYYRYLTYIAADDVTNCHA